MTLLSSSGATPDPCRSDELQGVTASSAEAASRPSATSSQLSYMASREDGVTHSLTGNLGSGPMDG